MLSGTRIHQPVLTQRVAGKEEIIIGIGRGLAFYYMEGIATGRLVVQFFLLVSTFLCPMSLLPTVIAQPRRRLLLFVPFVPAFIWFVWTNHVE